MAAITEDQIRKLASFRGEQAPVTSCYLDVDGRRHLRRQDYEHELQRLVRRARQRLNGELTDSVDADLRRIEEHVRTGLDRSQTRGVAFFACSAEDFFEVVELPVPVRSQLVVNAVPAVRQLEELVHEYERFGVLLVDRQRARLLVFELGELVERSELLEELPRNYDSRGQSERGDVASHVEELTAQHLRHAAEVAFRVFQETGFAHLSLGGPAEVVSATEAALHPYLRERLGPRISVSPAASTEEIRRAALAVEAEVERAREQLLVDQLREGVERGQRAVAGIDGVLAALTDRRADRLLVSEGFSAAGWHCRACGLLATVGRICTRCGAEMDHVDDLVEEAVEEAVTQSCRVDICVENADLDCVGSIGALLRY